MSAPAIPIPEIDQARATTQVRAADEAPGAHRGGWFVRIAIVVIVLLWLIGGFYATRYVLTGSTEKKLSPILYIIGILFAPLTILLAILKWLFLGRL